jgi:hypothetical protein
MLANNASAMRFNHRLPAALAAAWLALSLLGAQTAGLGHRIAHPLGVAGDVLAHAGLAVDSPARPARDALRHGVHGGHAHEQVHDRAQAQAAQAHDHAAHHGDRAHDCAAYDAAALGAGPPSLSALPAVLGDGGAALPCAVAQRAGVRPLLPWQSRAPPAA